MAAGLREALDARELIRLERPAYEFEAQADTRIRNGRTIRAFTLQLAENVREQLGAGRLPVVVGGDCSILLGCL
jgi:arginase